MMRGSRLPDPAVESPDAIARSSGRYEASSPKADRLLGALFWMAEYAPGVLRLVARPLGWMVWAVSPGVRSAVLDNVSRLLPDASPRRMYPRVGRRVVANFIRFVADLGTAQGLTPDELVARATEFEGSEHYERAAAMGRGLIIATAHLGSFEVGLAVTASKAAAAHVVFATDPFPRFDRLRRRLREKLGVHEARAEGGWGMWGVLRDALAQDEVVVLQADRVMPGQKGATVELLGEPTQLPTGAVRLAQMTGAPIVPVFAVRTGTDCIRIVIDEPIVVETSADPGAAQRVALDRLASAIGRRVADHPDQWLMLHRVWGVPEVAGVGKKETQS